MDEWIEQVPDKLWKRFAEIVALTDRFCRDHLDAEFRDLCRALTVSLCQKRCPITSGKEAGWAAGIVYSAAWVNFLGDPSQPHLSHDRTHSWMAARQISSFGHRSGRSHADDA
ncbi:MAG: hypothetical protein QOI30_701 [Mycobacterium sp.]|nr:hypothetical protein [Mycobacterium sp.]